MSTIVKIEAELVKRELARRSFGDYLEYTGGGGWKRTRFSDFLARRAQEFLEEKNGRAYDILLIEAPPQHGKSMTITEALPSWYLGKYPDRRVILASYSDETAERFARRNREKLERFGRTLFGVEPGSVKRTTEFEMAGGGRLISRGLLSGITGNPADLLIIDDPVKNRQEADSESRRRLVWEEWLNTLKSRLSAGARVVVIMTPWHEDDLAGRLLRREKNIRLLRLPVEAGENDPLGRRPGEPLCPELGKGREWLAQFKRSYLGDPEGGPRAWAALYQCAPRTEEGEIVKRGWWKRYRKRGAVVSSTDGLERGRAQGPSAPETSPSRREAGRREQAKRDICLEPEHFGTELISVDAAFKGGENNDFVSVQVWGKRGNDYFCRYCLNRHLDFPGTLEAIRAVKKRFPSVGAVVIEDKANGSAIISVLQKEMFCIPVTPKGGKIARVHAVSPAVESGHVFLPEGEGWVEEFIEQFSAFPTGKHDDMVDAATQALSQLIWSSGETPDAEEQGEAMLDNERCYDIYEGGLL